MDLGISGRTALVAGGSAGLGRASALALAGEGARLFISARGEERLAAAAREISAATGAEVTPIVANHATADGREALRAACQPDILVVTYSPPPFTEDYRTVSVEQWREAFDGIGIGSIEMMRIFAEGMAERRYGRIVNISTMAAKFPLALRMVSGSTRAAIANYAAGLAKVVAKDNVSINSILPGLFETPGLEDGFVEASRRLGTTPAEERLKFLKRFNIPRRCLGEAEDVGALCTLLCSRFAGYVVGQNLVVDGGLGGGLF